MVNRECGDCTQCCQGWLTGVAHGHMFQPGTPCHYKSANGCSIYKDRPKDPCQTFSCAWLTNADFLPEWLKPNVSGVICTWRATESGIPFLDVVECGRKIDSTVLNWLILEHLKKGQNLRYRVDGGVNFIGQQDFVAALSAAATTTQGV